MRVGRVHDKRLVGTNLVEVCLRDGFLIGNPTGSHIDLALRVLGNEVLHNLTVFGIVGL